MSRKYRKKYDVESDINYLISLNIDDHSKFYENLILIRNGIKTSDDENIQRIANIENGSVLKSIINGYEEKNDVVFDVRDESLFVREKGIFTDIYNDAFTDVYDIHEIVEIAMDPESRFNTNLSDNFDDLIILYKSMNVPHYDVWGEIHLPPITIDPHTTIIMTYIQILDRLEGAKDSVGYKQNPAIKQLISYIGTINKIPMTKTERRWIRLNFGSLIDLIYGSDDDL